MKAIVCCTELLQNVVCAFASSSMRIPDSIHGAAGEELYAQALLSEGAVSSHGLTEQQQHQLER